VTGDTGDRLRRGSMWALSSGVAAIAAIVSYSHIYDLGRAHGGTGVAARLLPLSVDMLILVGELMLLHEGDRKSARFALGWVLVGSGVLATLAANVTYGAQFGAVGAIIWGWPAYSFILVAAGMVAIVKRAGAGADFPGAPVPAQAAPVVPSDLEHAAEIALRATLAAGNPYTVNALVSKFSLPRKQATELRTRVMAEANGNGPEAGRDEQS
jgi:Protein of unknown function (DUF2637)